MIIYHFIKCLESNLLIYKQSIIREGIHKVINKQGSRPINYAYNLSVYHYKFIKSARLTIEKRNYDFIDILNSGVISN